MALRFLIGLYGLLFVVIGIGFFVAPADLAAKFALVGEGAPGLAVLRADFPAFFACTGGFAILGAWRQRRDLLLFPLIALSIAISGRAVSLFADGQTPGALTPMAIEGLGIAILALARGRFPRG